MGFLDSILGLGRVRASANARAEALASARLERLTEANGVPTFVAHGRQTKGALPLRSKIFDGAVYSSRGRGYARYNEDAAGLFADEQGRFFVMVLDQAGGLGGRIRGEASAICAERIFEGFRQILSLPPGEDPCALLEQTFNACHEMLAEREQGEVTTAVAGVINPNEACLVNSGDSAALHFDGHGQLKNRTELHELSGPHHGYLAHGLGLIPEGANPEDYVWPLEAGDWLILCTDGLLDAELEDETLGGFLEASESAEEAVNRICTTVLRRMGTLRAKPDNLTVVALRRLG